MTYTESALKQIATELNHLNSNLQALTKIMIDDRINQLETELAKGKLDYAISKSVGSQELHRI